MTIFKPITTFLPSSEKKDVSVEKVLSISTLKSDTREAYVLGRSPMVMMVMVITICHVDDLT